MARECGDNGVGLPPIARAANCCNSGDVCDKMILAQTRCVLADKQLRQGRDRLEGGARAESGVFGKPAP